jgi:hypothetical protein
MARKRPTPTLHRFHPAAMNPVVVARPDNQSAPGATPVNPNAPRFTAPEAKSAKPNRATQIRRDDDNVKDISLTLYDVDFNVKRYIEEHIDPYILEQGKKVKVPVVYSSPEKWTSMQKLAALRDGRGKQNLPIIAYKRNSMTINNDLARNKVLQGEGNVINHYSPKYSNQNQYDRFSMLQGGRKKRYEYYSIAVPDFVVISYELLIWTDFIEQLNGLVEMFTYHQGTSWGSTYKFNTVGNSYDFETQTGADGERVTRCTLGLTVNAGLIPKDIGKEVNMKKTISATNVRFGTRTASAEEMKKIFG